MLVCFFCYVTLTAYSVNADDFADLQSLHNSANKGYTYAMYDLGAMYFNGKGIPQDYKQAHYWFLKAADKGEPWAMCALGLMYINGNGVPQDYKQAYYWYLKAADKGNAVAMYDLGVMLQNGKGTKENLDKAIYWFNKSLSLTPGDPSILEHLGTTYEKQQNYRVAFNYYLKSAKLGDPYSQMSIGYFYHNGLGTIQDNIEAYAWLSTAVANGFKKGGYGGYYKTNQNNAITARNNIATQLLLIDKTGDQLAKAKSLAKKYYAVYVLHEKYVPIAPKKNDKKITLIEKLKKVVHGL